MLEADSATDWTKVNRNIEALRQHLIDMGNVMLHASVAGEPVADGMQFDVSGVGAVKALIRAMTAAYAATMNGVDGWRFTALEIPGGAATTVTWPQSAIAKIRALGFAGILTRGGHHRMHRLMIAPGLMIDH